MTVAPARPRWPSPETMSRSLATHRTFSLVERGSTAGSDSSVRTWQAAAAVPALGFPDSGSLGG